MLKVIIIDDENKARKAIRDILTLSTVEFEIIAEGHDVKSGLEVIRSHHPDLVFLDIGMPDGTGFDLLKQLTDVRFKVVFVTAFEEFAIKAFEFSAIDYILKPIDPLKLIHSLSHASELIEKENMALKLNALFANLDNSIETRKKLVLNTDEKIFIINTGDIIHCQSDSGYTTFFLATGEKIMVSKNLKHYDKLLSNCGFFRTHQSHLVNVNYIDYYEKRDGGYIMLKTGAHIPLSLRKRDAFFMLINMI